MSYGVMRSRGAAEPIFDECSDYRGYMHTRIHTCFNCLAEFHNRYKYTNVQRGLQCCCSARHLREFVHDQHSLFSCFHVYVHVCTSCDGSLSQRILLPSISLRRRCSCQGIGSPFSFLSFPFAEFPMASLHSGYLCISSDIMYTATTTLTAHLL